VSFSVYIMLQRVCQQMKSSTSMWL